ncbi:MAG: hypothetical protein QXF25_00935, partial [Candidatus Pacearchaeota archaeon]
KPVEVPTRCPVCQSKLVREADEVAIRCINASCPAQIKGRLMHFASRQAMDIRGLGDVIIETLVDKKLVKDFADLYHLKYEDLIKLAEYLKENGANKAFFIQQFRPDECLDEKAEKIKPYKKEELENFLEKIRGYFEKCGLRNA